MTRVIVCRVGRLPEVEDIGRCDRLGQMQAIVGGTIDMVGLEDGLDIWFNDEGLLLGLPFNRPFPARAPAVPEGFELIRLGDAEDMAEPGEMGEFRIHGDLFLARCTEEGELDDVTDADILKYRALFADTDEEAAGLMLAMMSRLDR